MEILRSDGKRLAEEIACMREELSQGTRLKAEKRLSVQRGLERKLKDLEDNKEALEWKQKMKSYLDVVVESRQRRKKEEIISAFTFYCRSFHSQIARTMNLRWRDLANGLRKERKHDGMGDGDRWEGRYHREVFEHLQAFGFSKEEWQCSLQYATTEELDFRDTLLCSRSLICGELDNDRKMLNGEDANKVLSPMQKEVFAKALKEFEAELRRKGFPGI